MGNPRVEVGVAMTFISTSLREYDSHQLAFNIDDVAAIQYLASRMDDIDNSNKSTGEVAEDNGDEDDSHDEDVDEGLHKKVTKVAAKMDDSGFCSDAEDNDRLEVIPGPRTLWRGKVPSYSLRAPAVGSHSGMYMASCIKEATRSSFDTFLRECAEVVWCRRADGDRGLALGLHHSGGTETTMHTG